jgi:hypothetical protein
MKQMTLKNSSPTPEYIVGVDSGQQLVFNEPGEGGIPTVEFVGYSGSSVNLADYGFDAPVVYDLSGMSYTNTVPVMYRHYEEIGHTTKVSNEDGKLVGKGMLSIPNARSKEIEGGLKNKFPYQASMGLMPDRKAIDFYSKGNVSVNNQQFSGPVYVVRKSTLMEMTIAPFGRDSKTSFTFVNEDDLMTIKNTPPSSPAADPAPTPTTPVAPTTPAPAPAPVLPNTPPTGNVPPVQTPAPVAPAPVAPITNTPAPVAPPTSEPQAVPASLALVFRAQRLLNANPDYVNVIENGIINGWTDEQINNAIKLDKLEKGLPSPGRPGRSQEPTQHHLFEARVMASYGVSLQTIENAYGKPVADQVDSLTELSVVEQLVYCARQAGGDYTGHSDIEIMTEYYRNSGYSGVDLPNLLKRTAQTLLEERWKLNPPFATQHCKDESNKDFRKTERRRITGGGLWQEIDDDGKLPHYKPGKDTYYQSDLTTVGAIFTMTREEVINDDQSALRDLMDAMIEDSMLTPDIQLGKLMMEAAAAASFWVNNDNSFTGKSLTRTNLIDLYQAARQYNEARSTINWNTLVNDRWKLIHSVAKEDDVFDILQDRIVSNTTANTIQGDRNYLSGKLAPHVFAQMSNTSVFGSGSFVSDETYFLWPSSARFAPFSINYLRGRKRPIVEPIALPGDMLGRGLRGYWDVKVNKRERLTVIRAKN